MDATRSALLRVVFVLGFVGAGFLGRATIIDGGALSLVWPAAGVSVVWFLVLRARLVSVDTVLLVVATALVNGLTGASWPLVATFVVANVVQVQLVVALMRRVAPSLLWIGGTTGFSEARAAVALFVGATLGSLAGALTGVAGFLLSGTPTGIESALVWWGRNLVGAVTVVAVVHLIATALAPGGRTPGSLPATTTRWPWWEQVTLLAATAVAYGLLLPLPGSHPAAFLVTLLTVWAAVRASTLWTVVHAVTCGSATVVATLAGTGPFASASSAPEKALLAQLFLATLLLTGLALSTARHDRLRLLAEVDAERREARREAALSAAVLASMEQGVVVVDADDQIVLANAATTRIVGADQPRSAAAFDLLDRGGQPLAVAEHPFSRARRDGSYGPTDVVLQQGDGSRLTLSVTARALAEDGGSPHDAVVVVYRDVTRDRASRDALTAFAATVAHDLRGPLTSVRGWIDVASDELDPHDAQAAPAAPSVPADALRRALRGVDRMDGLIGDLLSHAQASDAVLDVGTVDLDDLVRRVVHDQGAADLVRVTPLPPALGDVVLVRQVVENLLTNAVKYVAPGITPQVLITGRVVGGEARVDVTDNGIGVPGGVDVFAPFVRAHPGHAPGTGLGLAICRTIVERHSGTLTVAPRPAGAGSTFTFTLPVPAPDPAPAPV